MVLVVEHVAVHHEEAREVGEGRRDVDGLSGVEPPGVLEPAFPGGGALPLRLTVRHCSSCRWT